MLVEKYKSKTLLISKSKKFIFIHNYKVAGTSVRKVLSDYQSETYRLLSNIIWLGFPLLKDKTRLTLSKHCFYYHIKNVFKEDLSNYTLFGFVRNPWDWEVSKYEFMKQNAKHFQHDIMSKFSDFDSYLQWRETEYRTQSSFFRDPSTDEIKVHLIKIEDTEAVNDYLSKIIGKKVELPIANSTKRMHYREYYKTEYSRNVIEKLFKEDIERFNYTF